MTASTGQPAEGDATPQGAGATASGERERSARERILDAAEELFAERGYAGAATKRIAEAAAVPEGLIFYHFGTKRALLHALIAERPIVPELDELAVDAATLRPRQLLVEFGRVVLTRLRQRERLARAVLSESYLDASVGERVAAWQRDRVELLASALRAASAGLSAERARTVARIFWGTLLSAVTVDPPEDLEAFLDQTAAVLLDPPAEGEGAATGP